MRINKDEYACVCGFYLGGDFFPHLEHGHVVLPVDLVGRRVKPVAFSHVLVENAAALHVAQTELTEVELREPVTSKQSHISFYSLRSKVHEHISLEHAYKHTQKNSILQFFIS